MIQALKEAARAWQTYESTIDWSEWCEGGEYPNMGYQELTDVMDAMDDLDAAVFDEEENTGSTFDAGVSPAERERTLDKARRVLAAYESFLYDVAEFHSYAQFEPYARRVSAALGVEFAGRRGGGSTGKLMF